jgi:hypothetical protein
MFSKCQAAARQMFKSETNAKKMQSECQANVNKGEVNAKQMRNNCQASTKQRMPSKC